MKMIRVLIADDSPLARQLLADILHSEPGIEVCGEASNGRQAVELARSLRPDLITMDLEMPVMSGMEAIEEIMHSKAVPILVVSSIADAHNALDAVGRGALEVINKPDYSAEQIAQFVHKVRLLAGIPVITRLRARTLGHSSPPLLALPVMPGPRLFVMASSTGGPQALSQILPALPAAFPCPVVIAQHIADGFAPGMVEWLAGQCCLPVQLASHGMPLQAGTIYISPSEQHTQLGREHRLQLEAQSPGDIYHPSCDRLLESAAMLGASTVGIILTGMGRDGARGMQRIRASGGVTIAQDEASSVIYGMNRIAVESGCVQHVLPLQDIAACMAQLAGV